MTDNSKTTGWQAMDTSPRDGTHFEAIDHLNCGRAVEVFFDGDQMRDAKHGSWIDDEGMTHWRKI